MRGDAEGRAVLIDEVSSQGKLRLITQDLRAQADSFHDLFCSGRLIINGKEGGGVRAEARESTAEARPKRASGREKCETATEGGVGAKAVKGIAKA